MNFNKNNCGWLEIICGPMFSGKSEELLRKLNRLDYAKVNYTVFTPSIDTRTAKKSIQSRNGFKKYAVQIDKPRDIYKAILDEDEIPKVIAIDEVQFLDAEELLDVVNNLIKQGFVVYAAGLDNDFRNVPFKTTSLLLSRAEKVHKLSSICTVCGSEGTCTQRIVDGEPAPFNSSIIEVGDFESYCSRCIEHHQLPGFKPSDESINFNQKLNDRIRKENK